MKTTACEQQSREWWDLVCGSIGGTRFGQVISDRKNRLVYELIDEQLNGYADMDDYVSDDMLFGVENEPIARQMYAEQTGIDFKQIGLIHSDYSSIHHASPDGLSDDGVVLEIKCTQHGAVHLQRFFEGVDSQYIPQIVNYFAVSDDVREVRWISYCPSRPERPIVEYTFTRDTEIKHGRKTATISEVVAEGRDEIRRIESEIQTMKTKFAF